MFMKDEEFGENIIFGVVSLVLLLHTAAMSQPIGKPEDIQFAEKLTQSLFGEGRQIHACVGPSEKQVQDLKRGGDETTPCCLRKVCGVPTPLMLIPPFFIFFALVSNCSGDSYMLTHKYLILTDQEAISVIRTETYSIHTEPIWMR